MPSPILVAASEEIEENYRRLRIAEADVMMTSFLLQKTQLKLSGWLRSWVLPE